jgi:hypothetical protein
VKEHIREDLILTELLSDSLFHVPHDIFSVKVKQARGKCQYFKCGGNHVGTGIQNAKFRIIYWKSRGEKFYLTQQKCDE